MKTMFRYLLPAAGLAAALPLVQAGEPAPTEKKEMRVIAVSDDGTLPPGAERRIIRMGGPQEMENVTFLGVASAPVGETLSEQLNLPPATGLVVSMVAKGSPAAGVLNVNDVLVKFDDQLLIEQRQLAVLVRNHQEGDEVTLTYIRGGKESTAKVKLAKHEIPKMALMESGPLGPLFHTRHLPLNDGDNAGPDMGREDMDRVLELIDRGAPGQRMRRIRIGRDDGPGLHTTTVSTSNSNMVFTDEQGLLDLTIKDGQKTLIAKNPKGEQVFAGPVTTAEDRKALPPDVLKRLDKLEGMQDFSFQTDDDFQGGEVRVVKPGKTKITLPQPESAAPAPRPSPSPF
jgi:serine protease Do